MEVKTLKNYAKHGLNQCEEDTSPAATLQVPTIERKRSARWLCSNRCPPPLGKSAQAEPLNSLDKIRSSQKAALPISAESCEFIPTSSCPPQESGRSSLLIDVWTGIDFYWVFLQHFRGRESVNHTSSQHQCYAWPPQKSKSWYTPPCQIPYFPSDLPLASVEQITPEAWGLSSCKGSILDISIHHFTMTRLKIV